MARAGRDNCLYCNELIYNLIARATINMAVSSTNCNKDQPVEVAEDVMADLTAKLNLLNVQISQLRRAIPDPKPRESPTHYHRYCSISGATPSHHWVWDQS